MQHTWLTWVAGGALFLAAGVAAAMTARRLASPQPPGRATTVLLWLLGTSALAVTAAALWSGPGTAVAHTWPFAIALIIAMSPLFVAAVRRRGRPHPLQDTSDHGRPAPR